MVRWIGAGLEAVNDDHAAIAGRAREAQDSWIVVILDKLVGLAWRCGAKQGPDAIKIGGALAVGEQAVMADPMEPVREDVEQEAPDELEGCDGHDLSLEPTTSTVVLVVEGNAVVGGVDQAIVGHRDPVGVAAEIGERAGRSLEGLLAVDEPLGLFEWGEIGREHSLIIEPLMVTEEAELALMMSSLELLQHQATKEHGEHTDR